MGSLRIETENLLLSDHPTPLEIFSIIRKPVSNFIFERLFLLVLAFCAKDLLVLSLEYS